MPAPPPPSVQPRPAQAAGAAAHPGELYRAICGTGPETTPAPRQKAGTRLEGRGPGPEKQREKGEKGKGGKG